MTERLIPETAWKVSLHLPVGIAVNADVADLVGEAAEVGRLADSARVGGAHPPPEGRVHEHRLTSLAGAETGQHRV